MVISGQIWLDSWDETAMESLLDRGSDVFTARVGEHGTPLPFHLRLGATRRLSLSASTVCARARVLYGVDAHSASRRPVRGPGPTARATLHLIFRGGCNYGQVPDTLCRSLSCAGTGEPSPAIRHLE